MIHDPVQVHRPDRRGFTLVELLVVCSILVLLIAMLMPSMLEARIRAKEVVCAANIRSLGLTCLGYAADNGRALPDLSLDTNGRVAYHTYHYWQSWRMRFESEYGLKRENWYSPTNPRWNRDDFYLYGPPKNPNRIVSGFIYWNSSLATSSKFYTSMSHTWTTASAPTGDDLPVFARRLTQRAYWDIMWTDLNRQWPANQHSWITPGDEDRYGANHMYESRYEEWPRGSHVLHLDGSLSWTEGKALECRAVYGGSNGTKYYW